MSASAFVVDVATGQPILLDLIDVFYTNSATKTVDSVLQDHGYEFTMDELNAAVQAAQSGSAFDIRTVAGMYKFTEPSDMVNSKLEVVPTSAKIYLDGKVVNHEVNNKGQVVWGSGQFTFTITFELRYNDDGSPKPITFEGTRQDSNNSSVTVKGEQQVPAAHWTQAEWALTAGWIATMFGAGFAVVIWALDCFKKNQGTDAAQRQIVDAVTRASDAISEVADAADIPLVDLSDYQSDAESSMHESVYDNLRKDPDAETTHIDQTRQAAGDAGYSQLREIVAEQVGPSVSKTYSAYVRFSRRDDAVDIIMDTIADKIVQPKQPSFTSASSYIQNVVEADVQQNHKEKDRRDARAYKDAAEQDAQDARDYEIGAEAKERAKADRVVELKEQGLTDEQIDQDAEVQRLNKEIQDAEYNIRESEKSQTENEKKNQEAEGRAKDAEKKEREARQKANQDATDVYGEGH